MFQDLRFAIRTLLKDPGFALVVVLTLAVGIGANTAVFSVVNAVLLRPLPFPHPQQLASLWKTFPGSDRGAISIPNLRDWRKQTSVFESSEAYDAHSLSMHGKNSPERVEATASTAGLVAMLGSKPFIGRLFLAGEDDFAVFTTTPLILLACAAFAAYLPARQATKIDPIIALRYE